MALRRIRRIIDAGRLMTVASMRWCGDCCDGHGGTSTSTPPPIGGELHGDNTAPCVKSMINQMHTSQTIVLPRPPRGGDINELLDYNRQWSENIRKFDPNFFVDLAHQQTPQYLWIGCSDSRVPANQVIGLAPGEVFVHRNIANVVARSDLNCLSVLQFAVEVLKVEHVLVVGHYGCGGVRAALHESRVGLADNWIMHVVDVKKRFWKRMELVPKENHLDLLCELNAISQLANVADTHVMQDWWRSTTTHNVDIHGWCYSLSDGIVKPLLTITRNCDMKREVEEAIDRSFDRHSSKKK